MIKKTDHIITAFGQSASGPGWGNSPVWIIVQSRLDGSIRQECIQPEDQTVEIHHLYRVSQAAHEAMTEAVKRKFKK